MSEVLAYAAALFEEHLNWRGDFRCLGIETEVPVDFSHKIENRSQQRTPSWKRLARVVGELPACSHALRIEDELVGIQALLTVIAEQRFDNCLPWCGSREI